MQESSEEDSSFYKLLYIIFISKKKGNMALKPIDPVSDARIHHCNAVVNGKTYRRYILYTK